MDINIYDTFEDMPKKMMKEIEELTAFCNGHDKTAISFPRDSLTLTASGDDELLGAAAFTPAGDDCYECSAFTYPDKRGRGVFSTLLEEGLRVLPGDPDILFYTDGNCPDTNVVLKALGASEDSSEYIMEYDGITKVSRAAYGPADDDLLVTFSEDGTDPLLLYSDAFAKLFISPRTYGSFLFDLEVIPEHRSEGHGEIFLRAVLADLKERGLLPVRLHVSDTNKAAFELYKKTGFRIVEALHTYIY